ncbi:unknown [Bacteroides sp. CAG:875]|nr:unknown [Bacteroides sp. CAG:875]
MLNNKCLLCAITLFPLSAAKIAIFVISSLQKTFFFYFKVCKNPHFFYEGE